MAGGVRTDSVPRLLVALPHGLDDTTQRNLAPLSDKTVLKL